MPDFKKAGDLGDFYKEKVNTRKSKPVKKGECMDGEGSKKGTNRFLH